MLILKLTDEQAASAGVKTLPELSALVDSVPSLKAQIQTLTQEKLSMSEANTDLKTQLTALETRLTGLEAKLAAVQPVDATKIIADAKAEAAREVSAAIARVGGQAIRSNEPPPDSTTGAQPPAADDFGAQWDASRNLKAEFPTKKDYEVFMTNQHRVHFNVRPENKEN